METYWKSEWNIIIYILDQFNSPYNSQTQAIKFYTKIHKLHQNQSKYLHFKELTLVSITEQNWSSLFVSDSK